MSDSADRLAYLESENKLLRSQLEHLKTNSGLAVALSHAYDFVFYGDLRTNTYTRPVSSELVLKTMGNTDCPTITSTVEACIPLFAEEFRDEVLEFLDLDTLPKRLAILNSLYMEAYAISDKWLSLELLAASRDDDGRVVEVVLIARDVTVRKEEVRALSAARDAAEAASRAKTRFLNSMSHDIRTPMNAVIGYTERAFRELDNPDEVERCLKNIKAGEVHLLNLINDVLEMSRIESGGTTLNLEPCDISNSIFIGVSMFEHDAEKRGIELTGSEDIFYPYVYQDESKNATIVTNIMGNALKYTPAGGHVHVSLTQLMHEEEGMCYVEFQCKDDGVGMSAEFLPRIFDDFSREHTSTESHIQGTGLGLGIVKRLIEYLGGTIVIESEQGVGTTVTTKIPHKLCKKEDVEQVSSGVSDVKPVEGKTVLLVEDNELNVEIARMVLEEFGLAVEVVNDGDEAVRAVEGSSWDKYQGVLMDIQMPRMNGYEAAKAIRGLDDVRKANIPIIAMTANAFEEDKRKALEAGMNAHVPKPIDTKLLHDSLQIHLR